MELGKHIKAYRKKQGLTQEDLAEKMNVSVGAVSKWESGISCPELSMLMKLALCFRTSIDALTGFELENRSREDCICQLQELTRNKKYEDGAGCVEEVLMTYPNDFRVHLEAAQFYHLKGVERKDRPSLERSLQLYRKATLFLDQNHDPKITRTVLEDHSAHLLLELGQYDEALEILKKNNIYYVNTLLIAQTTVSQLHQYEAALPLLSQEYYLSVSKLLNVSLSFAQAYRGLGRLEEAKDVLKRSWLFLASFLKPERISIFDKAEVLYRMTLAVVLHEQGRKDDAARELRLAGKAALRFNAEPSFDLSGFPHFYLQDDYFVYDDSGSNALDAIESALRELGAEQVLELWHRIREEQKYEA